MRVINKVGGNVEISWMWLPAFIGNDIRTLKEIDKQLEENFPPPIESSEELLDKIHDFVIDFLEKRYKLKGLSAYLDGMRSVRDSESGSDSLKFRISKTEKYVVESDNVVISVESSQGIYRCAMFCRDGFMDSTPVGIINSFNPEYEILKEVVSAIKAFEIQERKYG